MRFARASLVATFLLTACNSGSGLTGGNKKEVQAPKAEAPKPLPPTAQPPAQAPSTKPQPAGPTLGGESEGQVVTPSPQPQPNVIVPPSNPIPLPPPPPPPPPPVQPPLVQPPVPPPVQPPVAPQPAPQPQPPQTTEKGSLFFNAIPFVNMEHQSHAVEGWAILKSGGRTVAAGPIYPESACRGENTNSSPYPVVKINVALTYLQSGLASGSGTLSICIPQNATAAGDAMTCQQVNRGNDGDRPAFWYDKQVQYTVAGDVVTINNQAGYGAGGGGGGGGGGMPSGGSGGMPAGGSGFPSDQGGMPQGGSGFPSDQGGGFPQGSTGFELYGGSENIGGGLSFAHPIMAPVCGSKARGYADYNSPLVLDLNKNGKYELTSAWDPKTQVKFDVVGKGEKFITGWVGKGDALLALDVNGNGTIDNGQELFGEGSFTPKGVDEWAYNAFENGFQALAQYDLNKDGVIDAKDDVFTKILVWTDDDMDGVSKKSELQPLAAHKIKSLSLAYAKTGSPGKYLMVNWNEVRLESSYDTEDGKTHKLADVYFGGRRPDVATKEEASK